MGQKLDRETSHRAEVRMVSLRAMLLLIALSIVLGAVLTFGAMRPEIDDDGDLKTRLLVCAVLDELGADTVDPRIVNACPPPR